MVHYVLLHHYLFKQPDFLPMDERRLVAAYHLIQLLDFELLYDLLGVVLAVHHNYRIFQQIRSF